MSTCAKCGFDNEDSDIFCGSCGAFMQWSRDAAGARVGVASGAPARPEGGGTTLDAGPAADPGPVADADPVVEVADDGISVEVADPVVEQAGAEEGTGPEPARTRAESLVATPPEPKPAPAADQPTAVPPGAVKPAAPKARPKPVMAPPTRELQPGDLICGQCGEGNLDDRKFCRRCGSSLVDAQAVAPPPIPWWKRPFVRQPKLAEAGARPMRKGGTGASPGARSRARTGLKVAGGVLAVAVLFGLVGPWRSTLTGAFSSAKRSVKPTFDPVRPSGAEATSAIEAHPASAAIDGISNTYWAEGARGKGEGQALVLIFDVPVDIDKIGVLPGASGTPEEFLAQPRPKVLHLIFSDGTTSDLELKDNAEFQSFDVEAKEVNRVEVQIASVYSSVDAGQDGSIAELEFFQKR